MAEPKSTITLGVHLSVAEGTPVLVGSVDVPIVLTLAPAPEQAGKPVTNLEVTADVNGFQNRLAETLHAFADNLTVVRPQPTGGFSGLFHQG